MNQVKPPSQRAPSKNDSRGNKLAGGQADEVRFQFTLSINKVVLLLSVAAASITILSTLGHTIQSLLNLPRNAEVARIFNLGGEANVASWFSSALLLIVAALLIYISHNRKSTLPRYWLWLGIIFISLSIDETAVLHDSTLERPLTEWLQPSGLLSFPWVIFGWLFVAIMAIRFGPFVWQLSRPIRFLFLGAAALYISGALILEMVSALLFDIAPDALILRGVIGTIQELGEISGLILFIYALFKQIDLQNLTPETTST